MKKMDKKTKGESKMERLKIEHGWWNEIQPEGLPYPTSTLISGPGGTGKPLIGLAFVKEWLKAGGNVIFIPLQYPDMTFVKKTIKELYGIDLKEWDESVTYIRFDHEIQDHEKIGENIWKTNLLKPEVWEDIIEKAEEFMTEGNDLNTLVFSSALNLLLFSPTYREGVLDELERLLQRSKKRSYLFNVSTSAFGDEIKGLEDSADNLMFTRMGDDMDLYLKIERMENEEASSDEVRVPIKKEMLEEIKEVAKGVKKRHIPELKKI
ncbi:MAG: ATPase domain-containing protein [Thermoplasmata archaeon]